MTPCLPGRTLREKSKVYERGVSEAPRTHTGLLGFQAGWKDLTIEARERTESRGDDL